MTRLSAGDVRRALDIVAELHEAPGSEPMPMSVLRRLQELVDADNAAGYVETSGSGPAAEWVTRPDPAWLQPALAEIGDQDPVHRTHRRTAARPVAISDYLNVHDFHKLELYRRICEPLAVGDCLRLYLPAPGDGARFFFFDRTRRGFSARARLTLELLRPHLIAARERRTLGPPIAATPLLTRRQREVLQLVAAGRTNAEIARELCLAEHTVRKHLENSYTRLGAHSRTSALAALRALPS